MSRTALGLRGVIGGTGYAKRFSIRMVGRIVLSRSPKANSPMKAHGHENADICHKAGATGSVVCRGISLYYPLDFEMDRVVLKGGIYGIYTRSRRYHF